VRPKAHRDIGLLRPESEASANEVAAALIATAGVFAAWLIVAEVEFGVAVLLGVILVAEMPVAIRSDAARDGVISAVAVLKVRIVVEGVERFDQRRYSGLHVAAAPATSQEGFGRATGSTGGVVSRVEKGAHPTGLQDGPGHLTGGAR
jgi:hypothetical protein